MSAPRKPSMVSPARSGTERRGSAMNDSPSARNASPARPLTVQGVARTSSTRDPSFVARPNRASMQASRRPSAVVGSSEELVAEDNARIENAALIDNLKKSLRTSDKIAEESKTLTTVLQTKHDDLLQEYGKLEEQLHDTLQKLGNMEAKRKEESHSVREMANLYESERMSMLRDREEASKREEELRRSIQRLKETMAGREMRFNMAAAPDKRLSRSATRGRSDERSASVDASVHFAPTSSMNRNSSLHRRNSSMLQGDTGSNSKLLMQKDLLIESLRLELAEAQIKLVEMENMGGNHMQELEKQLLETRMTNARLMEDNESFQLLLSERSLNGDIMKADLIQGNTLRDTGLSSLAEEIENAEQDTDRGRRLELENKSLREEKKALTLYIDKIISRVLQHDNPEKIFDHKSASPDDSAPPPPAKDDIFHEKPSVIQRAMSVVGPRKRPMSQMITGATAAQLQQDIAAAEKGRPQSQMFNSSALYTPTAHEIPELAPSIPLNRTTSVNRAQRHRRTQSTQSADFTGATSVINQMYRGPANDLGAVSPVSPGTTIPRANYFNGTAIRDVSSTPSKNTGVRSTSMQQSVKKDTDSVNSRPGSKSSNHEFPSPPRNAGGNTVFTGAVMTQHKLRPLRLVQQKKEVEEERAKQEAQAIADEEAARKRANRASWMPGWFSKGAETPRTPSATAAVQE